MNKALLSAALLILAKVSAFASLDLGSVTSRTPYDSYMGPVKQVFSSLNGEAPSMDRVAALMRQGRAFRYSHTDPYNPALPAETASRRVGDCKDKALWLCDQLHDPSARFVIGKMKRGNRISHAWVMWQHEGRWWILDCTMTTQPIAADKTGPDSYVPLYSFSKGAVFRHTGNTGSVAGEAGKTKAPVASTSAQRVAAN
jgi:hypothetical protein